MLGSLQNHKKVIFRFFTKFEKVQIFCVFAIKSILRFLKGSKIQVRLVARGYNFLYPRFIALKTFPQSLKQSACSLPGKKIVGKSLFSTIYQVQGFFKFEKFFAFSSSLSEATYHSFSGQLLRTLLLQVGRQATTRRRRDPYFCEPGLQRPPVERSDLPQFFVGSRS